MRTVAAAGPVSTADMIQLTRLNNQPLVVNSDLIKFLERAPDTVLTLVTGEKIIVRESPDDVLKKIIAFRQTILSGVIVGTSTQPTSHVPSGAPSLPAAGVERSDIKD
jgi:flagellar protein FlbD